MLQKLGGYYLIPHELLHVLAYRLIGKPYHYRLGDWRVTSLANKTEQERIFVLVLPFVICVTLGLFFHFAWIILALSYHTSLREYLLNVPKWHLIFHVLANLCILYSGTAYRDIRTAWRILSRSEKTKQKSYQPRQ
jgi:hypothetical protein